MSITTYGVGGAGFLPCRVNALLQQVGEAGVIWLFTILGALTNDYYNNRRMVAIPDNTSLMALIAEKLLTQAGGINYCIKECYELNPMPPCTFFKLQQAFIESWWLWSIRKKEWVSYVEYAKENRELHGFLTWISFTLGVNTLPKHCFNLPRSYSTMNADGYKKIGALQVAFLAVPAISNELFFLIESIKIKPITTRTFFELIKSLVFFLGKFKIRIKQRLAKIASFSPFFKVFKYITSRRESGFSIAQGSPLFSWDWIRTNRHVAEIFHRKIIDPTLPSPLATSVQLIPILGNRDCIIEGHCSLAKESNEFRQLILHFVILLDTTLPGSCALSVFLP